MKKVFTHLLVIVVLLTSMNFFVSGQSSLDTISSVKLENKSDVFQMYESWIFSTYTDNFDPADLGGTALVRGMDTWNGKIYFPLRGATGEHKILVCDGVSGEKLQSLVLQRDIFIKIENGDTINAVTLPNNDLHFDNVGNCLIGGCVISSSGNEQPMLIYKVNLETGECEEIINELMIYNVRFDAFDVYGDINNNAIIMAMDQNSLYCYRWVISDGIAGKAEKLLLPNIASNTNVSSPGLIPRIYIYNDSIFYVDGHNSYATRYKYVDGNVTMLDNVYNVFGEHYGRSLNGCTEFQLKDKEGKTKYYFISAHTEDDYVYSYDLIQFADENKNFAEATYLCSFPENTSKKNNNTYRTAEVSVEVVGNVANIYWYIGENGFGKYTFSNGYEFEPNLIVEPNNKEFGYTIGGGFYEEGENITIQAFNYNGYVFSHWSDSVKDNPRTITISKDSTIIITAIFQEDTTETKLDGVFSVAKDKQIVFSPGNLQYKSTIKAWRFAENQYDIIGNANIYISSVCYNWIDLFGWGTSGYNNTYPENMRSDDSVDYGNGNNDIANTNYDWGVFNAITNGGNKPNMWRTLTTAEWRYIIEGRPNASSLYGLACINGINGAILLPDNWESIENISFTCYDSINTITNNYTLEQWDVLENSGAVFLPLAGLRNEADGFLFGNNIGVYWSSSYHDSRTAYGLYIDTINIYADYYNFRDVGRSVRLVKDTIAKYNIVLNTDNKVMGTVIGSGTYDYGREVTIEAIANEGYRFVKWSDGDVDATRTIIVTDNIILTAEFAINVYNVTLSAENGTVTGAGEYSHGTEVTLTATPNEGYHFVKWSDGDVDATRTIIVTDNITLTAEFAINVYNVTLSAENGTVTGVGEYSHGTELTLTATPNEGYHFVKWSDGDVNATRTIIVTDNITLTAEFAINVYNVTLSAENGIVTGAGEYVHGSEVTLTVTPNEGYRFVKWSDGNTDNPRIVTVTENKTYTAEFEVEVFGVYAAAENPSMGGVKIILTAEPIEGFEFVEWTDGVTDNPRVLTLSEDIEVYARFQILQGGTVTNIETSKISSANVYGSNGTLYIEGVETNYYVLDAAGRLIYTGRDAQLQLPRGVYMVAVGGEVQKVVL